MVESNFIKINSILTEVKAKIDAHQEFKNEYNKELAFDFDFLTFFKIGENKVSEILAYFINPNNSHGQGDIFLSLFIEQFYNGKKELILSNPKIVCEQIILNNRRIDLYVKLKNFTIAIENKIWAEDQPNQLDDYSVFLEKDTNSNYLLLYLTPFGSKPSEYSISKEKYDKLFAEKKINIISHKNDTLNLIDKWIIACKADKVTFFLKGFRNHMKQKISPSNTLNMSIKLHHLILQNENEINHLIRGRNQLEKIVEQKLNKIVKVIKSQDNTIPSSFILNEMGIFKYENRLVYKKSISLNNNVIWIQIYKKGIHLYFNQYVEKDSNPLFREHSEKNIIQEEKIEYDIEIEYIVNKFGSLINDTVLIFEKFNK